MSDYHKFRNAREKTGRTLGPPRVSAYLATRELASRDKTLATAAVNDWIDSLKDNDPKRARSLAEGMACLSTLGVVDQRFLLSCIDVDHHARAAAIRQLRFWHNLYQTA